jgi:hypothetical protein
MQSIDCMVWVPQRLIESDDFSLDSQIMHAASSQQPARQDSAASPVHHTGAPHHAVRGIGGLSPAARQSAMPPDPACRGVKRLVDAAPTAAADTSPLRREQGEADSSGAAKRIRCEAHALATDMVSRVSGPASEWGYKGKTILAPMVRVGTLPMRLLARGYGADIVYSEELIDHRLLRCQRVVDAPLPVTSIDQLDIHGFPRWVRPTRLVRYVLQNEQKVKTGLERNVFITYENEPVVLQLGTGDATRALRAAQTVAQDVRAIDINMGCPLSFSVKGGMGSALLGKPEVMHDIVSTLKRNLPIPVTIKIRLLEDEFALLELGRRAEMAGADAVAIHARCAACLCPRPPQAAVSVSIPLPLRARCLSGCVWM